MTRQEHERLEAYAEMRKQGIPWEEIGGGDGISGDAARCWMSRARIAIHSEESYTPPMLMLGADYEKKIGSTDWREYFWNVEETKRLRHASSGNNTFLNLSYDSDLHFICLGDLHFFSPGTDHEGLLRLTERILSHKNLNVVLLGDVLEMAINLRNVSEVTGQLAPPVIQLKVLESWLEEIKDRVLFSTWDNHSSERLEKHAGVDVYGWLMAKSVPFFDGIGVANIKVGEQTYKVGATHKMRGKSILNATHGQQRYMRFDDQSLDIMLAGDSHVYGQSQYADGDRHRLAVNCGTANTNSAYGKRYFGLYSHPVFPVVSLYSDIHEFNSFISLVSWEKAHGENK
jgi:hypothetical protein